jgi:homoaconitate hydratase
MKQNLIEKIAQKSAVNLAEGQVVKVGDYISIRPHHVMTHDNTGAVMNKFNSIGATKIFNPRQPVFTLDHNVQDDSKDNLKKYAAIETFAKKMGVDFYPAGRGIGHQIMIEEGYAWPGAMVVASDSHSNMYGGIGALGTPIVRTDAAAIWATGQTWWQVPTVSKVELLGKLRPGVTGKDVIITLAGFFNSDDVLNHALEFSGEGLKDLTLDQRLTIANMTTEWGALAGVFPIDDVAIEWIRNRIKTVSKRGFAGVPSDADTIDGSLPRLNETALGSLIKEDLKADKDATYAKTITLDLSTVEPFISGPHHVKVMISAADMAKEKKMIQKAYLVSCVNSRVEDLAEAARIVKGKTIAEHVEFYVAAASDEVQTESERRGDWQVLKDAGARTLSPGCGPCIGLGTGLLKKGEVGISATNRNFKGRMGSKDAEAYLASPAVVAKSALSGYIDTPFSIDSVPLKASILSHPKHEKEDESVTILDGFPSSIEGEIIFCHQDNMNTDGIFPGKYTYIDDFTPQQQAKVVMENYDSGFGSIVESGDILVGGYNFGTGSSREQAATALKYRGLALVIAGSFSETYKRNAINNGFLVLESPELVDDLKAKYGIKKPSIKTSLKATLDFTKATLTLRSKVYQLGPVGEAAQELVLSEGLENWVKQKIAKEVETAE